MVDAPTRDSASWQTGLTEVVLLVMLFFAYAGDPAPMVNEAHYLVKAKNFWNPDWCASDLFASSAKAHTVYYFVFGWPLQYLSLTTTAWLGRLVGWTMIAIGLQRLCRVIFPKPFLSLIVAVVWLAGIEYGNLAGEWVIGGTEAKVPAYALVLCGLAELVRQNWGRVWVWFGAASAFHVLTGGWSVIAALIACLLSRHELQRKPWHARWLLVGGSLALFGLFPALALTVGVDSDASSSSAQIYTYTRLSHHLLPADFQFHWYLRHLALVVVTLVGLRTAATDSAELRLIGRFTIGAIGIAAVGLLLGMLPAVTPDLAAKLLRYYWFRLADAMVPLTFALLVAFWIAGPSAVLRKVGLVATLIGVVLVVHSGYQRCRLGIPPSANLETVGLKLELSDQDRRQRFQDWIRVCTWARLSTGDQEVFLTPRHQQTFKWYAGRAEVVNWKDVPQDAESLAEWNTRFHEVYPQRLGTMRVTIEYKTLREFRRRFGCRYMIVDRLIAGENLPLVQIYPVAGESNKNYSVYELPR